MCVVGCVEENVGRGVMKATLTADPLAVASSIVVTVEGESVAIGTDGIALSVVFSFQTDQRIIVCEVTARNDDAQGLQIVVDVAQNIVKALTSVTNHFTNLEVRKTTLEILEAGDGL
jgi:hypothetical protein